MEPDHDWIHPAERDYSDLTHPELFQEKAEIRDKDIPIRMKERSDHQQQSRKHESPTKKRPSNAHGTLEPLKRSLPGYKDCL